MFMNVCKGRLTLIDENLEEKLEEFIGEADVSAAKLFYEFKYRTVMEAATKLTQFALIFFSISSLITAVTVLNEFDEKTQELIFYCVLVLVIVFALIGISIMYGVIAGLVQIRATFREISLSTYMKLDMDSYFIRGIRVLAIVSAASILGLLTILFLIFQYS